MSYTDIYNIATNPDTTLRKQIAVALRKAAIDVLNDGQASAARRAWANQLISNPENIGVVAAAVIWRVLDNVTIAASPAASPDGDVQFVVNSLIGELAGE